ncbi:hypothetical protein FB45DRAFT_909702 [Roridomyces roridus]|uniref:Rhodopsin domain-containing protein n=1 Tax=Roridomyces roridus TaxID=1738132 RepID=A0AAD7FNW8_9AGAR|nr:hypothetical protein FB45DRAFT_909702 [Roridomyces roridus]
MSSPTLHQLRVALSVLPPFAIVVTYFRLYLRKRARKLWWDDFWAFVSTLFAIAFVVVIFLHIDPNTTTLSQNAKVAIYYLSAQTFYGTAWSARISILFTIIRLSAGLQRRFLLVVAIWLFVAWAILFSQVWWVCEAEPGWKELSLPQCVLGRNVAIAQFICDIISDIILIATPVRLLLSSRLQRALKLRLVAVFATTSITTAVALYHSYTIISLGGVTEVFAANIQISISLLVANLSVVTAFLFRLGSDGTNETDNRTPFSNITFGGTGRTRGITATTFGGIETTVHQNPHLEVRVSISQTDDGKKGSRDVDWNDSTVMVGRREEHIQLDNLPVKAATVV